MRGRSRLDVQVAWSPLFTAETRRFFFDALGVDDATIARSQGAAVHQACAALPYYLDTYPLIVERSWHKLAALGIGAADKVIDAVVAARAAGASWQKIGSLLGTSAGTIRNALSTDGGLA